MLIKQVVECCYFFVNKLIFSTEREAGPEVGPFGLCALKTRAPVVNSNANCQGYDINKQQKAVDVSFFTV